MDVVDVVGFKVVGVNLEIGFGLNVVVVLGVVVCLKTFLLEAFSTMC